MGETFNSRVYAIKCLTTGSVYIGSTKKTIEERLKKHESHLTDFIRGTCKYISSFEIIIRGNLIIETLEEFNTDKLNLRKFENDYIELYRYDGLNVVNKNASYSSIEDRLDYYRRYNKQYYLNNKEKIDEKVSKYYLNNKEKILEKNKKYTTYNKEKIYNRKRQTITCDTCQSKVTHSNLTRHKRTKKCQSHLPT